MANAIRNLSLGQAVLLAVLFTMLTFALVWAAMAWTSEDVTMSIDGWIALGLGTTFSLAIGCGLMALMFYGIRSGDHVANPDVYDREQEDRESGRP